MTWWSATVLRAGKMFADDTTLPVLDPGRGRTKTGRLWCYAVDDRPWCGPDASGGGLRLLARIARANAPPGIWQASAACCRSTAMPGSSGWPESSRCTVRLAFCWAHMRRSFYEFHSSTQVAAGRRGAGAHPCSFMRSRPRSADIPPSIGGRCGTSEVGQSSRLCMPGCRTTCRGCPPPLIWPRPCATRSGIGPAWCCSSMTVGSRWTRMWSSAPSGRTP